MSAVADRPHRPAPGTPLRMRWRKWDGSPHWVHECLYLGADAWGDWVGQSVGARSARPGRDLTAESPIVTLLPSAGDHAVTFNAPPEAIWIYIDLAWELRWVDDDGAIAPQGIDMDLDVVHARDGRGIYLDDEDEWAEHRVRFGYPPEVVAHLESRAAQLLRRVRAVEPPFGEEVAASWFARLAELSDAAAGPPDA